MCECAIFRSQKLKSLSTFNTAFPKKISKTLKYEFIEHSSAKKLIQIIPQEPQAVPQIAPIATEHDDEMQRFEEEELIHTKYYEMEGNLRKQSCGRETSRLTHPSFLDKQTGEILTFVEGQLQVGALAKMTKKKSFIDESCASNKQSKYRRESLAKRFSFQRFAKDCSTCRAAAASSSTSCLEVRGKTPYKT